MLDTLPIDSWRATLIVASLTAAAIQVFASACTALFRVPEQVFLSSGFHCGALAAIVLAVVLVRQLCDTAFRAALASRDVRVQDDPPGVVTLSEQCPWRGLVVLSLRLHGRWPGHGANRNSPPASGRDDLDATPHRPHRPY